MIIVCGMLIQTSYIQHQELEKVKKDNIHLQSVIIDQKDTINRQDSTIDFLRDDNQILSSYLADMEFKLN
jgi:hypothetical protein